MNTDAVHDSQLSPPASGGGERPAHGGNVPETHSSIIASYNPRKSKFPLCSNEEWAQIAELVRSTVSKLDSLSDHGVRPYLTAMTKLSVWALHEGLPLDPQVLLSSPVIEAFTASLPASASTFRSNLRRLAAVHAIAVDDTVAKISRPAYGTPYTFDEVKTLLTFARSMSHPVRRRKLTGCVLLGAGCGFARTDLRCVSRAGVHAHDGVLHVRTHDRCAPVLSDLVADFCEYLTWCGDAPFVNDQAQGNITHRIASWVGERAGVPTLSVDRLRGFYIVEQLQTCSNLADLLAFCGLSRCDGLDQYLTFLPPRSNLCGPREAGAR